MKVQGPSMQITSVKNQPQMLTAVVELADKNKKWLGLLPREAIREFAKQDQIVIALDETGSDLLGYLVYYAARMRAKIVHLCVDESRRGLGVGRLLVEELKRRVAHLDGITLFCRKDYPACRFYSAIGFQAVGHHQVRIDLETRSIETAGAAEGPVAG